MLTVTIEAARTQDAADIEALVSSSGLPLDGLRDLVSDTLVAREDGRVVGVAALEVYADGALLRSVAVRETLRGSGIGIRLADAAISLARQRGIPALYLLTTTAEGFFPKFGFARTSRDDVPESVRRSVEFTTACPASAAVMVKRLTPEREASR
jgi:amino-acid N-acetyltransferase